jgi:signal transduction histidine kinase
LTEIEGKRAHFGVVLLWEENSLVFTSAYPHEEYSRLRARLGDRIPLPEGVLLPDGTGRKGVCGRVALNRAAENVPDVREDEDYLEYFEDTLSELAVPLISGDRLIGVLNVEHEEPGVFDDEDIGALQALAEQAVIAILNAETYQELEDQQEELEKKKGELAAHVAVAWAGILGSTLTHDIGGHAAAIRNSIDEITDSIRGEPVEPKVAAPLQDMRDSTARVHELANQLRLSPEELTDRVDIHMVLTERIADWKRMYRHDEPNWVLEHGPDVKPLPVRVNRLALVAALDKLVDNAIVAMRGQPVQRLTIRSRGDDKRVAIDFVDTGPGIPKELIPQLFKERIVKKSGQEGAGIGLFLVNLVMRASGGGVHLSDTGPDGTTFTLWLPLEK